MQPFALFEARSTMLSDREGPLEHPRTGLCKKLFHFAEFCSSRTLSKRAARLRHQGGLVNESEKRRTMAAFCRKKMPQKLSEKYGKSILLLLQHQRSIRAAWERQQENEAIKSLKQKVNVKSEKV